MADILIPKPVRGEKAEVSKVVDEIRRAIQQISNKIDTIDTELARLESVKADA